METSHRLRLKRENLFPDLIAGVTTAIANIRDAIASAIPVGTNPVCGSGVVGTGMIGQCLSNIFVDRSPEKK